MPKIVSAGQSWGDVLLPEDEVENFKVLTAQEAAGWRSRQTKISMMWILWVQGAVFSLVVALLSLLSLSASVVPSFVYGGVAGWRRWVVMVFGLRLGGAKSDLGRFAQGALVSLWFWEAIKVLLSVLLLVSVPLLVKNLNWLAFLAGLVLVLKVYWIALVMMSRRAPHH